MLKVVLCQYYGEWGTGLSLQSAAYMLVTSKNPEPKEEME